MARRSPDGLYKRGVIWWGWRRKFPGGPVERASTKCRDRKAARIVATEWERQAADPVHYASNQTTLDDAIAMFLDDSKRKGLAPPTLEMYESKCAHIARVLDGTRRLNSVVATTWDGYISTREAEGASSHSVKKELNRGFGVLKAAKRRGLYPHDLSTVMPAYSARYVPRTRALTMDELQRLGRELRPDRLAHVAFVVATGCRLKESYRATTAHLLDDGFVFLDGTKTKRARRTIPIAPPLRPFLAFAVQNAPGNQGAQQPPLVPIGRGDEIARARGISRENERSAAVMRSPLFPRWHSARRDIHAACERAGIAPCSWNDLRRSNATLLAEADVGGDVGHRLLGHVDSRMWDLVYAQPKPVALQRSLEAAFANSTPAAHITVEARQLPAKKAESATEKPGLRSRRSEVRILCGAPEIHESSAKAREQSSAESAEIAGLPHTSSTQDSHAQGDGTWPAASAAGACDWEPERQNKDGEGGELDDLPAAPRTQEPGRGSETGITSGSCATARRLQLPPADGSEQPALLLRDAYLRVAGRMVVGAYGSQRRKVRILREPVMAAEVEADLAPREVTHV